MTRVVVLTGDPVGPRMAGPAIRATSMARVLAEAGHAVTLVTSAGAQPIPAPYDVVALTPRADAGLAPLLAAADVVVFQGHAMAVFPSLRRCGAVMVVDVYDPMHLEQLEQARHLGPDGWDQAVDTAVDVLNEQLQRGDFFLCASERQRHFWLGQLAALGRVNPAVYAADPELTGLLAVVPFGLSAQRPVHERAALRGVRPGIEDGDQVLIWSGGLYDWFDPETLISAVAELSRTRPGVRLFFQGTKHPNPLVQAMPVVARAIAHATALGALDRTVFFHESWVDYADRQSYLTEADAGVSTHFAGVETTFSFRTRILDYLWAGLPMVVTEGDHFADLVTAEGLGVAVPAKDVAALTAALDRVLYDDDFRTAARAAVERVRATYEWERVLAPLVAFCAAPRRAGDREPGAAPRTGRRKLRRQHGLVHDAELALLVLRREGLSSVAAKVRRRLR